MESKIDNTMIKAADTASGSSQMERVKRDRVDGSDIEGIRELFISNIPYNVTEAGVVTALKRIFAKQKGFVGIKKVTPERGFATVEFETPADAEAAVASKGEVKLGPRTLNIKLNDPHGAKVKRMEREARANEQRSETLGHDTDPNPECWFCLANPSGDKNLIFAVDSSAEAYVSLSRGAITPLHSFVCPVTHFGCFAQASDQVRNVCVEYCSKMSDAMESIDMDTIVYERWIPMNANAANHMQVHLVPIEKSKNSKIDWSRILKDKGRQSGVEFIRVKDHFEVAEKMKGILNRVSYLFISFMVDGKLENWLGLGKLGFTFPREVICSGLECPDRVDWKTCVADSETENTQVERLRSLFYPS
jgi:hypothetical protein